MSIQDDAFEFYRSIWKSPNRDEIKAVVAKLKSSARGYPEKTYPVPILGLLLYDQTVLRKLEGSAPIDQLSSWSTRELKVLFGVHEQMRLFNERCLAPLITELPQCIDAANPYKKYPVTNNESEAFFFKSQEAEKAIRSFHTHPAFGVLLSTAVAVRGLAVNYEQTVLQLDSEIASAGLGETSEWVANFDSARRWDADSVTMFRHAGGLVCLYNALANLDQLIYLGLFQDELIHLDRNNIIDFVWTTGGAGPSMWLLHIPGWSMFICEPTDLITVDIDRPKQEGGLRTKLCQISSQTLRGSISYPATLKVRMIDENLSAYPYLIR
jgi:hypothetical protein